MFSDLNIPVIVDAKDVQNLHVTTDSHLRFWSPTFISRPILYSVHWVWAPSTQGRFVNEKYGRPLNQAAEDCLHLIYST